MVRGRHPNRHVRRGKCGSRPPFPVGAEGKLACRAHLLQLYALFTVKSAVGSHRVQAPARAPGPIGTPHVELNTASADATARDRLYVARDLEVTARAFPGLNFERACSTPDRAEYDAWLSFASKYQNHDRLSVLVEQFLNV